LQIDCKKHNSLFVVIPKLKNSEELFLFVNKLHDTFLFSQVFSFLVKEKKKVVGHLSSATENL